MDLRPYQINAVNRVRDCIKQGKKKVLCIAPTGAGKTVIFSQITAEVIRRNKNVLIVAHRRELIEQTYNKVKDAGVQTNNIGVILSGDKRSNPHAKVQIASIDTLRNRTQKPVANVLIIDECHRCLSASYTKLIEQYPDSIVLGFTATPWRLDGQGLGRIYQDKVIVSTVTDLINDIYLVTPRVFSHPETPDLSEVKTNAGGDYDPTALAEAVDKAVLVGNLVDHWIKLAPGARTIAFAASVEHSKHIAQTFLERGIPAEHLDGQMALQKREAILERLRTGETLIVSNCGVLTEGFDCPAVKCAILARPTKSRTLYFQAVGRAMRPVPGAESLRFCVVLDHAGCAHEHGLVTDPQDYSLEDRKKRNSAEKVSVKTCPNCYAVVVNTETVCPNCAFQFDTAEVERIIKEKEGELLEIEATKERELAKLREVCAKKCKAFDKPRGWRWRECQGVVEGKFGKFDNMTREQLLNVIDYLDSDDLARKFPVKTEETAELTNENQISSS